MFEKIKGFFMNILNAFHGYTVEEVTGIKTNITNEMYRAINLWADMASGHAPWSEKSPSCGILDQIAGRLHMMVSREIGLEVNNPAIEKAMYHLNDNVDKIVDYITLFGGCVARPVFSNGKLQYQLIPLGNYLPTRYDFDGTLTGALILKQIINGQHKFLLTEEHLYENENHSVKCTLYNNDEQTLRKVSLASCPQTENLTEEYTWHNVKQPMIIEFRSHCVNKIDGSNVPVALIGAEGVPYLVKCADEQFERMNWEQKSGERKMWADRDLFVKREKKGNKVVGSYITGNEDLNRLIMQVEGDGSLDYAKVKEVSPTLRTAEQNAMFQQILRRIELTMNIGKGTISDAESVQQTATQYNGGRQELYAIVDKIEDEIEVKYQTCADVFAYMAAAYGLGSADSTIVIKWNDDATRKDITAAKQIELQEIASGVRAPWEYRRDFMGEDEETAKVNVPQAQTQGIEDIFGKE